MKIKDAALALTLLLATFQTAEALAQENSELKVALDTQPTILDTHVTAQGITNQVARNIFETILTVDADLQIQPGLAEKWEVSADGLTYMFDLREGVKFHDGQDLTAADVVASLDRWSKRSAPGKALFSGATWNTVDRGTIKLTVSSPSYRILQSLANISNQPAVIYPESAIKAASDGPVQDIVGTGPYKLVEWVPDRHITVERYEEYRPFEGPASGFAGNRTPHIDAIKFMFVQDDFTRLSGLRTGEYDFVASMNYDLALEAMDDPDLWVDSYRWRILNLHPNKARGFFKNADARRAVNIGLNREDILFATAASEKFFATNHHVMMKSQERLWNTSIGKDGYELAKVEEAKELLAKADYNGEELVLLVSQDGQSDKAAVVIQEQLSQLGLKVKIDVFDQPTVVTIREKQDAWDLYLNQNALRNDPSEHRFLAKDFPGWTNDPKLDDIFARMAKAATIEDALVLYDELQAWYMDYVPSVRIGEIDIVMAGSRRLKPIPTFGGGPVYWSAEFEAQ